MSDIYPVNAREIKALKAPRIIESKKEDKSDERESDKGTKTKTKK